ncbi:hypothetical protein M758_6G090000 [Ceratodon purpureus]|nr:hypothetical protein M758_6G090000 [Ceratodon purpureus]
MLMCGYVVLCFLERSCRCVKFGTRDCCSRRCLCSLCLSSCRCIIVAMAAREGTFCLVM